MPRFRNTLTDRLRNKIVYGKYLLWPKTIWFNWFIKRKALRNIRKRLSTKGEEAPVRVIFFALSTGMWKYDPLFKMLLNDNRFQPIIVPYPQLWISKEEQIARQNEIISFCMEKNYPYLIGYDISTGNYISARELDADFVCFTQPYNNQPYFWKVEQFYHNSLIFYYPYGFHIDLGNGNDNELYNQLIHNVAWKIFYNSPDSYYTFKSNKITRGRNFVYVGNLAKDEIEANRSAFIWKDEGHARKRIIWAPHHTIGEDDAIPFSNFLNMAEPMVQLAKDMKDKAEFAFKPHPALKDKLYEIWGKDKTDAYYGVWDSMPNTILATGDYKALFATSDALVHDCVTFMFDYLYTGNPVMFINRPNGIKPKNKIALDCYNLHYQGYSMTDVSEFIHSVVLNGEDPRAVERAQFQIERLQTSSNTPIAKNIFKYFTEMLEQTYK